MHILFLNVWDQAFRIMVGVCRACHWPSRPANEVQGEDQGKGRTQTSSVKNGQNIHAVINTNPHQLSPTLANSRQWNLWREKTTGGFLDDFTPPNAPINSNLFTRTKNNPAPPKKGGDQKRPARKSYKRHSSKSPPATPASISQPTRTVSTPSSFPIFSMTSAT